MEVFGQHAQQGPYILVAASAFNANFFLAIDIPPKNTLFRVFYLDNVFSCSYGLGLGKGGVNTFGFLISDLNAFDP